MELFKEELKFRPTGNKVVVNWKEAESTLTLSPEMMMMKEMQKNGITQVAAVGPDVKVIKTGDWVLLNAAGRLIKIDGKTYGVVLENQIDGAFDEKPKVTDVPVKEEDLSDRIKTDKTESKIIKLNDKYDIN